MKKAVDGLILRETPVGDSDKLLTVLTAEEGRFLLLAKGVHSSRSRTMPLAHLFTYGNFEYYEKEDRRWLSGGSINDNFYELHSDMEGYALAAYIVQIAADITGEGVAAPEILRMTLNTLYCISHHQKPFAQIKAVYELFAAAVSGFEPNLDGCGICGKETEAHYWLDVMNGRLLCDACLQKKKGNLPLPDVDAYQVRNILLPMDASSVACMRYICQAPLPRIFAFSLTDEESQKNFYRGTETYLLHHLERNFDTLDFYKTVKDL